MFINIYIVIAVVSHVSCALKDGWNAERFHERWVERRALAAQRLVLSNTRLPVIGRT